VRNFNEAQEDEAVVKYCRAHVGQYGDTVIQVFRDMRSYSLLNAVKRKKRGCRGCLSAMSRIVGVPAEFFTKLGLDIKNRSPVRYTYIAGVGE
jgi:hypothetical protein